MERCSNKLKIGLVLAGLGAIVSSNAMAEMQLSTKGGLRVYDPSSPCYWFCLNGRLDLDEVLYSGTYQDRQKNYPSSANIRRAVLAFGGGVGDCLSYNLSFDFGRSETVFNVAGFSVSSSNHTLVQEAWLGYSGLWEGALLRVGQFTPLSTMDFSGNDGTGNGQMFLESALATTIFNVPSYLNTNSRAMKGLGIILNTQWYDTVTASATIYQPPVGSQNSYNDPNRSDRLGEALRLTYSPVHSCDQVFHLGALGRYQSLNHTNAGGTSESIRNNLFFGPPEVISRNYTGQLRTLNGLIADSDPNLLNAGMMRAKSYAQAAGEALAICGPLTLQGEYQHVTVHRKPESLTLNRGDTLVRAGNVKFHGWHAQGGYVLTGESRSYDFATGTLGGIKPCGSWGAWEVVARYSYVTLMDKDVYGGAAHNVTAGLNWYVNDNVRLAFNYIRTNLNPTNTALDLAGGVNNSGYAGIPPLPGQVAPKRHLDIFAGRVQVVF